MKTPLIYTLTALVLVLPGYASATAPRPKISMQTARTAALKAVPHGVILSSELETEHGKLIYSFDIRQPHRAGIEEVQISAIDGRLVSHTHETPAKEKAEAAAEAKEQHKPK